MKKLRFLCCLVLLVSQLAKAQDFSNKGKEFWIAYPAHVDGTTSVMGLYITSSLITKVTVELAGGSPITFTTQPNVVTRVFLNSAGSGTPPGNGAVYFGSNVNVYQDQADGVKSNSAIKITADDPIVVYSHIIRAARSAATLVLPTAVLGNEYIAPSISSTVTFQQTGNGTKGGVGEITVVATAPNTVVTITPTVAGRGGRPAGTAFNVSLPNAGDCYQFQSVDLADISGTKITSSPASGSSGCKPIAVFSATTWSAFDCTSANGGDNLYQQLFPVKSWGKTFVTAPFINRPEDIFHIYRKGTTATITVQEAGVIKTLGAAEYNATGNFYIYRTNKPLIINGSEPISVVQYITSLTCKTGCLSNGTVSTCFADPEMVVLSPVEQTLQDITFFSAHKNYVPAGQTQVQIHFVNLVISKNYKNSLKIDNAPPTASFIDIPGSNYSYLQEDLTTSSASNPVHRVTADTNFAAIVYGYGDLESYGYNGGTNVKDFTPATVFQNPYSRVDSAVTCANTPTQFYVPLTFRPQSIVWDFSAAPNISPNVQITQTGNVVADSTSTSNGQAINYYSPNKGIYTFIRANTSALRDTIKLFTTSATPDGCGSTSQTFSVPVKVYDKPTAKFNLSSSNCISDSIHLTDQSTITSGSLTRWLWNFGDNTTDDRNSGAVFAKKYTAAGSYTIKMKAISDIGCAADDVSQTIVLTNKPNARFTLPAIACTDIDITFTDASTTSSGTLSKWIWDLDNGAGSFTNTTNAAVTGKYPVYGTKNPSLQVEMSNGCRSDVFVPTPQLKINPAPEVGFIAPAICLNDANALFSDTSKIAEGSSTFTYLWNFNAGTPAVTPGPNITTSTLKNPQVTYRKADIYTVSLSVKSALGCTAVKSQAFTVNGSTPKADFEILSLPPFCGIKPLILKNNSSVDFGGLTRVELFWDLVNSPTVSDVDAAAPVASGKTYQHSYPDKQLPAPQQYTVKLLAYSGGTACMDAISKTVTVYPQPQVAFTASKTELCYGDVINFTDKSNGVSSPIVSWRWDLGHDDISPLKDPQKQYNDSGVLAVKLVIQNADGCKSDTAKQVLTIYPNPKVLLKHEERVLQGGTFTIVPQMIYGNDLTYLWTPATYLSSDTAVTPVCKPDDEITYTLHLSGTGGCTVTDTVHVIVLKGPEVPNVFSPNGDGINDVWKIKYLEYYPDATVQVFNRFGQVVYSSIGYNNGWDGTYKGSALPIGTYYYIINPRNGRPTVSGSVTIIK